MTISTYINNTTCIRVLCKIQMFSKCQLLWPILLVLHLLNKSQMNFKFNLLLLSMMLFTNNKSRLPGFQHAKAFEKPQLIHLRLEAMQHTLYIKPCQF